MHLIIAWLLLAPVAPGSDDPVEIVRRSVESDWRNWDLARNYTYQERIETKQFDSKGRIKDFDLRTFDVTILYGQPYRRLIAKNDKPLPAEDARKAEEKLSKLAREREKETPEQREKRLAEYRKQRERQRAFAREIPEAFHFRLLGRESVGGHDAWLIEAEPRSDFRPREDHAKILSHFRGRLWIDTAEHQWVKVEAEAIDTISFGLVLARISKGTRISFEQTRVNEEIWLPQSMRVRLDGRLALFLKLNAEESIAYSSYKKFQADSRIVSTEEAPSEKPPNARP